MGCSLAFTRCWLTSRHTLDALVLLIAVALLASCATRPQSKPELVPPSIVASSADELAPVMRYARYTLVEITPTAEQDDLLAQIIDVTLPPIFSATVGDALRYVLLRSGYSLCTDRESVGALEALPLPAAHLHLGPLTLRQALQVLAGPGWALEVDEAARLICYAPRATSSSVTVMGHTP
jgi:type IV pili sensor histidine kinase/response regulator